MVTPHNCLAISIAAQLMDAWVWPALRLDALTDTLARCAGVVQKELKSAAA